MSSMFMKKKTEVMESNYKMLFMNGSKCILVPIKNLRVYARLILVTIFKEACILGIMIVKSRICNSITGYRKNSQTSSNRELIKL